MELSPGLYTLVSIINSLLDRNLGWSLLWGHDLDPVSVMYSRVNVASAPSIYYIKLDLRALPCELVERYALPAASDTDKCQSGSASFWVDVGIPFLFGLENHALILDMNSQTSSFPGRRYSESSGSSPIFSNASINHVGP